MAANNIKVETIEKLSKPMKELLLKVIECHGDILKRKITQ